MTSTTMPAVTEVRLSRIEIDGSTQPRVTMSQEAIESYAESERLGQQLPPVVLFQEGAFYWVAEGFHRIDAHKSLGRKTILATVHQGGKRDAILWAVNSNHDNGVRLTPADKRKSVRLMLEDPEWRKWTDVRIAEQCRVSRYYVSSVRMEMDEEARKIDPTCKTSMMEPVRLASKGGVVYEMKKRGPVTTQTPTDYEPPPEPEVQSPISLAEQEAIAGEQSRVRQQGIREILKKCEQIRRTAEEYGLKDRVRMDLLLSFEQSLSVTPV